MKARSVVLLGLGLVFGACSTSKSNNVSRSSVQSHTNIPNDRIPAGKGMPTIGQDLSTKFDTTPDRILIQPVKYNGMDIGTSVISRDKDSTYKYTLATCRECNTFQVAANQVCQLVGYPSAETLGYKIGWRSHPKRGESDRFVVIKELSTGTEISTEAARKIVSDNMDEYAAPGGPTPENLLILVHNTLLPTTSYQYSIFESVICHNAPPNLIDTHYFTPEKQETPPARAITPPAGAPTLRRTVPESLGKPQRICYIWPRLQTVAIA